MTNAEEKQLLADVAQMKREVHTLTQRIVGAPFADPPIIGMLDVQKQHTLDLYGDPKIQHDGLKPQVGLLVKRENELRWWIGGVTSVAIATWFIIYNWSTITSLFK